MVKKFGKLSDEEVIARYQLLCDLIESAKSLEKVILIQQRINIDTVLKQRSLLHYSNIIPIDNIYDR